MIPDLSIYSHPHHSSLPIVNSSLLQQLRNLDIIVDNIEDLNKSVSGLNNFTSRSIDGGTFTLGYGGVSLNHGLSPSDPLINPFYSQRSGYDNFQPSQRSNDQIPSSQRDAFYSYPLNQGYIVRSPRRNDNSLGANVNLTDMGTGVNDNGHEDVPFLDLNNVQHLRERDTSLSDMDLATDSVIRTNRNSARDVERNNFSSFRPLPVDSGYSLLSTLVSNLDNVDAYVIAVEMFKAKVKSAAQLRDIINYRVIDPSVYGENTNGVEYTIQILNPTLDKQYHVGFGDIIRLKRTTTKFKVLHNSAHLDFVVPKCVNSSMRVWHCEPYYSDATEDETKDDFSTEYNIVKEGDPQDAFYPFPEVVQGNIDNNSESGVVLVESILNTPKSTHTPIESPLLSNRSVASAPTLEEQVERLKAESITLFGSPNVKLTQDDAKTILKLRRWVKENLNPVEHLSRQTYMNELAYATTASKDYIVNVVQLKPEPDVDMIVRDATDLAAVTGIKDILFSNVFGSHNPIQTNDWIKLRAFIKTPDKHKLKNGLELTTISPTDSGCITRLPILNRNVHKIPKRISHKKRVCVLGRLDTWGEYSHMNNMFPRELNREPGYVERILLRGRTVELERVTPEDKRPYSQEEGEIIAS